MAAYVIDGLELLKALSMDLKDEGVVPSVEPWSGEAPKSLFFGANDRLWDLTEVLSSKVVPVFERGKGAWTIYNESTGRMVVRGDFLDHALLRYVLEGMPDKQLLSLEATLWQGRTKEEKGRKIGRVGVVSRSGQKVVGRMVGEDREMTLKTTPTIGAGDGILDARIDFRAVVGGQEIVLGTGLVFEPAKSRWIELGGVGEEKKRYGLELRVARLGGQREGEFERKEHQPGLNKHLAERRKAPNGDILRARSMGWAALEFLATRLDLGELRPTLAPLLNSLRLDASTTVPLPIALGGLKKGSPVVDVSKVIRDLGMEMAEGHWVYYHLQSSVVLSRLSADKANQDLMTTMLESLQPSRPKMIRVLASLIQNQEGREEQLGSASVMALPGGKAVSFIGKKEGARLLEGVQFEVESNLGLNDKKVDVRFSFEQRDEFDESVSKDLVMEAGATVEIPLKNQRVLRVKATVEQ